MKIGILTFHNTTNYGAVFQTYALQKYINNKGVNCEVIDYNNNVLLNRYDINPFHSKNAKQFIKRILLYSSNNKLKKGFQDFLKKYVNISKKKYNEKNIKEADRLYDTFIAGSDQIWNLALSGNDENYFMTFSKDKKKRNSYAASIGKVLLSAEEENKIKYLISKQNNISMRERQGKELIERITTNHIGCHIDPTFLVSKLDWEKLKANRKINYKYIFVYEVSHTDNLRKYAQYLSQKTGLRIIFISGTSKTIKNSKKVEDATPEEFLNYIYNAEYVVTSSFHGMALSIILNKEFYYDIPENKNSLGSRLENLADIFNLKDRKIVYNFDEMNIEKIDYDKVNNLIKKQVSLSDDYIQKIISHEN